MPSLLAVPHFDSYDTLLYKTNPTIQELIHLLSNNERSLNSYLQSINNQFQDSVESVNSVATVISNLLLKAEDVGFTISGGVNPRTLIVDLNLRASNGLFVAGTSNRIQSIGGTTLGSGGQVSVVDIDPSYVGQESITVVGNIHTGTWTAGDFTVPLGNSGQRVRTTGRLLSLTFPTPLGNSIGTTESTFISFILPANSLSQDGQSITIYTSGHFASNGNDKRVRINLLNTPLLDSGIVTLNNVDWVSTLQLVRINTTHISTSSVFLSTNTSIVKNTSNLTILDLTLNTLQVTLTGSSPTTGAANDVLVSLGIMDYAS